VVAIDVLRATTTAVTALNNGARAVRPVLEPPDAILERERLPGACLLGGERGGLPIEGFDLGNSPREYGPGVVQGKTIILTTSNGTRLLHAARTASEVLLGAMVNAKAVARALLKEERPVLLACAGRLGRFSWEDFLCAGQIISSLAHVAVHDPRQRPRMQLTQAAAAAVGLYHQEQDDLVGAIARGPHGRYLADIGLGSDIKICGNIDSLDVVPRRAKEDPKEWTI
jgi:2-phosphosulfolactate phosphatase